MNNLNGMVNEEVLVDFLNAKMLPIKFYEVVYAKKRSYQDKSGMNFYYKVILIDKQTGETKKFIKDIGDIKFNWVEFKM